MDQATIQRYQPGGDIYQQLAAQYGTAAADTIAQAAQTGDEGQVNTAITQAEFGAPLDTSTSQLFTSDVDSTVSGLASDAGGVVSSGVGAFIESLLSNAWVLLALGVAVFYWIGGFGLIRGRLKK